MCKLQIYKYKIDKINYVLARRVVFSTDKFSKTYSNKHLYALYSKLWSIIAMFTPLLFLLNDIRFVKNCALRIYDIGDEIRSRIVNGTSWTDNIRCIAI